MEMERVHGCLIKFVKWPCVRRARGSGVGSCSGRAGQLGSDIALNPLGWLVEPQKNERQIRFGLLMAMIDLSDVRGFA